jgi:hypothetical protein
MLLFAAGHTFGFLNFDPGTSEGRAVLAAMNNTHFTVDGSTFSYGEFYRGFGLTISAVQLFEAWLAWQLGSMARRGVGDARTIAWGMVVLQVVGVGLSLRYVSIVPAVLSLVTAITLAVGAVSVRQMGEV